MEPKEPNVCVDLDGVLAEFDFPAWLKNKRGFGKPLPAGRTLLQELREQGVWIIIHTARALDVNTLEEIKNWLNVYGMPFDEIWTGQGKPSAAAYIDDRAVEVRNDYSERYAAVRATELINQWREEKAKETK